MKLLVTVKRVIDYNVQIRVKPDGSGVEKDNVKMSMNPPDENAVEEALRIKESGKADEIIVLSIGSDKAQETIRTALAMGADRGIHIKTDNELEPLAISKIISKIAEEEKPSIILMGKQAIDDDCNQTGQMLAGILGWPQATFISKITLQEKEVFLEREVDSGVEELKTTLPCIATVDLRLNNPRFISLPNIIKAKKKEITVIDANELNIDLSRKTKIIEINEPQQRERGEIVQDVDELIDRLGKSGVINK